jgi:hypothetical protein
LTSLRPAFISGVFPERGACLTGELPALLISTSALIAAMSSWSCMCASLLGEGPFCFRRLEWERVPAESLLAAVRESACDQLLGVVPFVAELLEVRRSRNRREVRTIQRQQRR